MCETKKTVEAKYARLVFARGFHLYGSDNLFAPCHSPPADDMQLIQRKDPVLAEIDTPPVPGIIS